MKAEDSIRFKSDAFDREAWAELWDRLPERGRRGAVRFVLQQLHALESGGNWQITWHYDTNVEREDSGAPIFAYDQPGDVITFKGSLRIGKGGGLPTEPAFMVSVPCLTLVDWKTLRETLAESSDLPDEFTENTRGEDERFAELVRSGKNPCRVIVPAAEFLAWCTANNRSPNAASREAFAGARLQQEVALYVKRGG
jgi:hypothetical protein